MAMNRRQMLVGAVCAPAVIAATQLGSAAAAQTLKISHQFPGGTIEEGDFRDRLCRSFAAELEKRTNGAVTGQVYPEFFADEDRGAVLGRAQRRARSQPLSDLLRGRRVRRAQYRPDARPGQLIPAGRGLEDVAGRAEVRAFLAEKGVVILSWIWQAGGVASRARPIVNPEDAKGLKVRGGSREMDMVLQAAGATTLSTPSNELYAAMQTGACDAAHHLVHQPDLVPARRGGQEPDHRPRQVLLVHA